jgi:enamine deaminase RidA (YjgF/YER057c/UK114 family)
VPDDVRGHIVKAFVVPAAGVAGSGELARELQAFTKAQLAPYKYPRAVEFVTELPRTLTGKVQRYRLRQSESGARADASADVQCHQPAAWPPPKGYAHAVSATGRTVFVAGQIGWDPVTCRFPDGGFTAQVRQALANVVAALGAAGARPEQITRLTWYITDRNAYRSALDEVGRSYRETLGRHFPAMSVIVVSGLVEPEALVEIEATAVVSGSMEAGSSDPA